MIHKEKNTEGNLFLSIYSRSQAETRYYANSHLLAQGQISKR